MDRHVCSFLCALHESSRTLPPQRFRPWALRELQRLVPCERLVWGYGSGGEHALMVAAVQEGGPSEWAGCGMCCRQHTPSGLWLAVGGAVQPLSSMQSACGQCGSGVGPRDHGLKHMVSCAELLPGGGGIVFISLCRDRCGFTGTEQRMATGLIWQLFVAARNNDHFSLARMRSDAGYAIVDRNGHIHSHDERFAAQASCEWGPPGRSRLPLKPELMSGQGYPGRHNSFRACRFAERYLVTARPASPLDRLTRRERQIASGFARGNSCKEVARALSLSPHTVRNHLQNIYRKLAVRDKAQLARLLN